MVQNTIIAVGAANDITVTETYSFFVIPVLLISITIMFLIGYREVLKARRIRRENDYMELQRGLLSEYYDSLQNQIDFTRKFRHDLANHIQMVEQITRECGKSEALEVYVTQLQNEYNKLKKIDFCEDMIIDAVLHKAKQLCDEKNVEIFFDIQGFENGSVAEIDMFGIIYTLLGASIRAVQLKDNQLKNGETKPGGSVHFAARTIAQHPVLRVKASPIINKEAQRELLMVKNLLKKYEYTMEVTDTTDREWDVYINVGEVRAHAIF